MGARCLLLSGALALVLLNATRAEAALIEVDLPGGNLNEVTRDSATGLDWLDLPETANVSFNDGVSVAIASFGPGWRHATGIEICNLLASHALGVPATCPSTGITATAAGREPLMDLLGVTLLSGSLEGSLGHFDDETGDPAAGFGTIIYDSSAGTTEYRVAPDDNPPNITGSHVGNWIVRASVPEPSAAVLVALAFAGLAAVRRRQR